MDPFAEGVLIVATNKDTKKLSIISSLDKVYQGKIKLGEYTDSFDCDGKIIKKTKTLKLNTSKIKKVLSNFIGKYEHYPPMFSAKKIDGVKLYEYARNNISIKRTPIVTTIFDISLLSYFNDEIEFQVSCSKGTYVRVLAVDISEKLNTLGHLNKLIRLNVGSYSALDSLSIAKFEKKWKSII